MTTTIKTRIIKIGNSQGIRLPKLLLEQSDLGEDVELEVDEGQIIVRPAQPARAGWDEAFQRLARQGDDQLLDADALLPTTFDDEEWEW